MQPIRVPRTANKASTHCHKFRSTNENLFIKIINNRPTHGINGTRHTWYTGNLESGICAARENHIRAVQSQTIRHGERARAFVRFVLCMMVVPRENK